eukprot:Clim_evm10s29 gene=Clim_evmTU10s29
MRWFKFLILSLVTASSVHGERGANDDQHYALLRRQFDGKETQHLGPEKQHPEHRPYQQQQQQLLQVQNSVVQPSLVPDSTSTVETEDPATMSPEERQQFFAEQSISIQAEYQSRQQAAISTVEIGSTRPSSQQQQETRPVAQPSSNPEPIRSGVSPDPATMSPEERQQYFAQQSASLQAEYKSRQQAASSSAAAKSTRPPSQQQPLRTTQRPSQQRSQPYQYTPTAPPSLRPSMTMSPISTVATQETITSEGSPEITDVEVTAYTGIGDLVTDSKTTAQSLSPLSVSSMSQTVVKETSSSGGVEQGTLVVIVAAVAVVVVAGIGISAWRYSRRSSFSRRASDNEPCVEQDGASQQA